MARARRLMTVDARLPLNLAFTGVKGDRVLAEPVSIDVVGDSLPVDLIPDVTELVTDVHGRAAGQFAVRGTLKDPELSGSVTVDHGTMTIAYTGATIDNIAGRIRMAGDSVYVDSLAGSAAGAVRLTGALSFANWREPAFNLQLVSDGARLFNNDNADLTSTRASRSRVRSGTRRSAATSRSRAASSTSPSRANARSSGPAIPGCSTSSTRRASSRNASSPLRHRCWRTSP